MGTGRLRVQIVREDNWNVNIGKLCVSSKESEEKSHLYDGTNTCFIAYVSERKRPGRAKKPKVTAFIPDRTCTALATIHPQPRAVGQVLSPI